jgi:wobble nucleotide-excising tRNase
MITKVNRIRDFGVFRNFSWQAAIPDFKQFNLIYGWNYSGKTTLSRVFRCFELAALHENYLAATFELEDGDGNKFDQAFTTPPVIRVFNSDFIRKNLQWENENIEPIFMLGEENAELQTNLTNKKSEIETAEANLATAKFATQTKSNSIEQKLTDKARTTSEFYSWRNFTKTQFRPYVDEVKDNPSANTLTAEEFEKNKSQALPSEIKPRLNTISFAVSELTTFKSAVEAILHKQVTAKTIQKLLDNIPLGNWVETGKKLHEGKTICEYCENTISDSRIEELNNHFSKDYDNLKLSISEKTKELESALIKLAQPLSEATSFYTDIQAGYTTAKTNIETEMSNYNSAINSLIADLKSKQEKPFDKLEIRAITDNNAALKSSVTAINATIEKNNQRTEEFDIEKNAAIEKLKYHYAAEFELTENYSQTLADIASERIAQQVSEGSILILKGEKLAIENQLSETVKGAEQVNDYLKIFFGKDDIKIEATPDNKFKLLREGHEAKNLSEGEKTAIAFAYFTAKIEERNNKITETIIYIDDPISSLDSNHLFNLYSFIKNKFVTSKQLFISSHNFEFFNLLKEWFLSNKEIKKDNRAMFLIERPNNAAVRDAEIKTIHKLLVDFKSEYHYLFWLIHCFKTTPSTDFYQLYNLPNLMRRYLEAFLGFKVPKHIGLESKLEFLIDDSVVRDRVLKFIHHYSHGNSLSRALNFPDLQECTDIVTIVIDAVESKDKIHFDSLVEVVTSIAP